MTLVEYVSWISFIAGIAAVSWAAFTGKPRYGFLSGAFVGFSLLILASCSESAHQDRALQVSVVRGAT